MLNFLTGESKPPVAPKPTAVLLVIQSDAYDWEKIFGGCTLRDGRTISVVQTGWKSIAVGPCENYGDPKKRCIVAVTKRWVDGKPVEGGATPSRVLNIRPDFVLIRNETVTPGEDNRAALLGLMYAGVPSVNCLASIYMNIERPVMMAAVNAAKARVGSEVFPVVEQCFFPSERGFFYGNTFPAVVKFGSAHAGMGKMRVRDHKDMEDVKSVVPMTKDGYAFAEPFIEGAYDLRVQKIGAVVRVFKRVSMSGSWKTNTGSSHLEELPLTPEFAQWADIASKMFGPGLEMDICTVDAIVDAGGRKYILEVNGTSSGLCPEREVEDNILIRDLVIAKLDP
jgi:glutathione synthase/RimK-type ligase-like ATP-grasp enzyme